MLINLWLSPINNDLQFDLPPVSFIEGQKICVSRIFIEWNQSVQPSSFLLHSTLIEKSPTNPKQQLLFVPALQTKQRVFVLDYTPTHKSYYKIQCMDLKSSQFNLFDITKDKNAENLLFVYLQLEVIDGI